MTPIKRSSHSGGSSNLMPPAELPLRRANSDTSLHSARSGKSNTSYHSQRDQSLPPSPNAEFLPYTTQHAHVLPPGPHTNGKPHPHPQHKDVWVAGDAFGAALGWVQADRAELAEDEETERMDDERDRLLVNDDGGEENGSKQKIKAKRVGKKKNILAVESRDEEEQRRGSSSRYSDIEEREQERLHTHSGQSSSSNSSVSHNSSSSHLDAKTRILGNIGVSPTTGINYSPSSALIADSDEDDEVDEDDYSINDPLVWAKLRRGSIARRSRWRRPGVGWLLPMIVSMALALGMGMAPKQELYVNLACLTHPPRSSTTSEGATATAIGSGSASASGMGNGVGGAAGNHPREMGMLEMTRRIWNADPEWVKASERAEQARDLHFISVRSTEHKDDTTPLDNINTNFDINPSPIVLPALTPADKWMLAYQRRIAAQVEKKKKQNNHTPWNKTRTDNTSTPILHAPHRGPVGNLPPHGDNPGNIPASPVDDQSDTSGQYPGGRPIEEAGPGEIDPRACKKNPATQAAAAKLSMMMTLSMGILSAMTTGFWGAMSDRIGRSRVMGIAILGLVMNDVVLLLTATYPDKVPGGYRFLIVGPILDGLLGGFSTIQATNHAYLSDVTPDGSRAKLFGRYGGILMAGFAVGPILGAAVIKLTDNILSVFYAAVVLNTTFVLFAFIILPESLSSEAREALGKMVRARALKASRREQSEIEWEREDHIPTGGSAWHPISRLTKGTYSKRVRGSLNRLRRRLFGFLTPLAMFLPKTKEVPDMHGGYVIKRDWNLTLVVVAGFCASTTLGIIQLKAQYTIYSYGWSSVELGPYMTMMGACRGLTLLVLFPLVVKYFKPRVHVDTSQTEDDAIDPALAVGVLRTPQTLADSKFDLRIMRCSWALDMVSYAAMSFTVSAPVFVGITGFIAFGSASGPAMSSLALNLIESQQEAGALFGAMSVVTAISASFFGPLIFSLLFANTVGWYAPSIFVGAVVVLAITLIILAFIDLPKEYPKADPERGRTRIVKRVESSSGVQRFEDESPSSSPTASPRRI